MLIFPDHLRHLFLREAIAFDHGRVVSRKQAGCLSQICEHARRDRQRTNGFLYGFDPQKPLAMAGVMAKVGLKLVRFFAGINGTFSGTADADILPL